MNILSKIKINQYSKDIKHLQELSEMAVKRLVYYDRTMTKHIEEEIDIKYLIKFLKLSNHILLKYK